MSQSTCILQPVKQLSALLQNPVTVLPVFVRFQQAGQQLTIPIVNVEINGEFIEVKAEDGRKHSIKIELLLDIVALRDGGGKPVFLTEFTTGDDIVIEYRNEIKEANNRETARLIKKQMSTASSISKDESMYLRKAA